MPLPAPNSDEEKSNFIERCIANPVMNKEFGDNAQRYAVCQSQYKKRKQNAKGSKIEWTDGEIVVLL